MNKALGAIPVTIKLRTGVKDGKNTAEKLMIRAVGGGNERGWGVGCITVLSFTFDFSNCNVYAVCYFHSYMAVHDNNDIQNSQIGVISDNA